MGSRSPTMMKAHVSPGLRVKTKPQIEQRSNWDHPENSGPSPQCGQRLRNPRPSAVRINVGREGVIHKRLCGLTNSLIGGSSYARVRVHLQIGSKPTTKRCCATGAHDLSRARCLWAQP